MEKTSKTDVAVGSRVGCFLSVVDGRGLFLGFGTYVGEEVPPNEGRASMTAYLAGLRRANPKIVLDSGDVVWGCECWWGPEDEVKAERAKLTECIDISIQDARNGIVPPGFGAPHSENAPMGDFFGPQAGSGSKDFWS